MANSIPPPPAEEAVFGKGSIPPPPPPPEDEVFPSPGSAYDQKKALAYEGQGIQDASLPFVAAGAAPAATAGMAAFSGVSHLANKAGEKVAEKLGEKGYTKTGAALGTAISVAPDAIALGALGKSALSGIKNLRSWMADKAEAEAITKAVADKSPLVTDQKLLPFKTGDEIEKGGGTFLGHQETSKPGHPGYVLFNDPKTDSTLMLRADQVTADNVSKEIARSRETFGVDKAPAIPQPAPEPQKLLPAPKPPLKGPIDLRPAVRYQDGFVIETEGHGPIGKPVEGTEAGFVDKEGKFISIPDLQAKIGNGEIDALKPGTFKPGFTMKDSPDLSKLPEKPPIETPRMVVKSTLPKNIPPPPPEEFWDKMGYTPGRFKPGPDPVQNAEKAVEAVAPPVKPPVPEPSGKLLSPDAQIRVAQTAKAVESGSLTDLSQRETLSPRSRLDILAQKNKATGPITEHTRAVREADFAAREASVADKKAILQFGIPPESKLSARLFRYAEAGQDPSLLRDLSVGDQKKVTDAAMFMRSRYDTLLDGVNKVRVAKGLDPIVKRANYVTHYNDMSLADEFGMLTSAPVATMDAAVKKISSVYAQEPQFWQKFKSVIFQHAVRPEGQPYTEDAVTAFMRYSNSANRYINMTPAVDELNAAAKVMRAKLPNLASNLESLGSYLTGHQTPLDLGVLSDPGINKEALNIIKEVNRRYIDGVLEGNPSVPIAQFLRLVPVFAENNPLSGAGLKAFVQQISPAARAFALESSQLLRAQVLARTEKAVGEGTLRQIAGWLPQALDREMAMWAWNKSYTDAVVTVGHAEAVKQADALTGAFLPILSAVDRPALLRSTNVKLVYPLINEATVWANHAINDIWRNTRNRPDQAMRMARWVVAVAAVNTGMAITAIRHPDAMKNLLPLMFPGGAMGMAGVSAAEGLHHIERGNVSKGLARLAKTAFVGGLGPFKDVPARLQIVKALEAMTKEEK